MRQLAWTPKALRAFKRLIRQNPQLRHDIERALRELVIDPFKPSLRTHKLGGDLSGSWACSIDYSNRILFEFTQDPAGEEEAILLLNMGDHDAVY
jgi:mRNA-degrading endonuclease YafQ of YafQ-DinJ toxin-antitoxin module